MLLNEKKTKAYKLKLLKDHALQYLEKSIKCIENKNDKYSADFVHWNAKDDYLNKRNTDKISTT